ncbi:hypothetical protein [Acinetobacter pittii]|uniref:hypothetical protein n=1 Tax=Acinetobacter pittii TaxID=48296 RepID=UPI00237FDAB3|nr:hypothetical protein [Acinetobacter pittii]MDE4038811.1 hypothetical protein [Acinetobacter pittii]
MDIVAIVTEVVGGPRDGEFIASNSNGFITLAERWDSIWQRPSWNGGMVYYEKKKAFLALNGQHYFREFFLCKHSDPVNALLNFRKSLTPIYLNKSKATSLK